MQRNKGNSAFTRTLSRKGSFTKVLHRRQRIQAVGFSCPRKDSNLHANKERRIERNGYKSVSIDLTLFLEVSKNGSRVYENGWQSSSQQFRCSINYLMKLNVLKVFFSKRCRVNNRMK